MNKIVRRKLAALLMALCVCSMSIPIYAFTNTNTLWEDKISDELKEMMEQVKDSDSPEDKIPVYLWYEDIDQEVVEERVEEETGLTKESLSTDLSMPSAKVFSDMVRFSRNEDAAASQGMDQVQEEMQLYLEATEGKREVE